MFHQYICGRMKVSDTDHSTRQWTFLKGQKKSPWLIIVSVNQIELKVDWKSKHREGCSNVEALTLCPFAAQIAFDRFYMTILIKKRTENLILDILSHEQLMELVFGRL